MNSFESLSQTQFAAALDMARHSDASPLEKANMLMEIGMGLQHSPKSVQQLHDAVALYQEALRTCPTEEVLLRARIEARQGTALQATPDESGDTLATALACFERALAVLNDEGKAEEIAEIELNSGLVRQSLTSLGRARITDAIACYHRSLRTFTCEMYPQEFAILHNNLAVAYLSIPATDDRAKMREALAVQSFEEVLKVITLIDHPTEYAMIQNNLGNALQYVSSSHVIDNNLRALAAYDEALKVRTAHDTPLEYANTLSNKANVLRNLPRGSLGPQGEDPMVQAQALYREAQALFERFGDRQKSTVVAQARQEVDDEIHQRRLFAG